MRSQKLSVCFLLVLMSTLSPASFAAGKSIADNMVLVKGGCFQMGDKYRPKEPGSRFSRANVYSMPIHEVCVDDFNIGKYETTQREWEEIMGPYTKYDDGDYFGRVLGNPAPWYDKRCGGDCPAENISYQEIMVFIHKLNAKTGKNYRLPTDAEWEFAARARGKTKIWIGTNNLSEVGDYGWFGFNTKRLQPVGKKKPNAIGLYDMSGNVSEVTVDSHDGDFYSRSPKHNPKNIEGLYNRVSERGGSFTSLSEFKCCKGLVFDFDNPSDVDVFGILGATSRRVARLTTVRWWWRGFRLVHDVAGTDISWLKIWHDNADGHIFKPKGLNDVVAGSKKTSNIRILMLARGMCSDMIPRGQSAPIFETILKRLAVHMKEYEGIAKPTGVQILNFLNKNRHKMLCKDSWGVEKNYMMYSFDRLAYSHLLETLFNDILTPEDWSVTINLNAVSYSAPGGKPETVLDYMNRIINDKRRSSATKKEVISLKGFLVSDLGAKTYKQLSPAEKKWADEQLLKFEGQRKQKLHGIPE